MKNKNNFKKEKEFLDTIRNIKRKRKEDEVNLFDKLMKLIDDTPNYVKEKGERNKELLKTLIINLDKDIKNLNPTAFVMEVNTLISKLVFIAKSKNKSVPAELLIPYLSINEEPSVWLSNLKDGIVPYLVNGELFDIIKIKDK